MEERSCSEQRTTCSNWFAPEVHLTRVIFSQNRHKNRLLYALSPFLGKVSRFCKSKIAAFAQVKREEWRLKFKAVCESGARGLEGSVVLHLVLATALTPQSNTGTSYKGDFWESLITTRDRMFLAVSIIIKSSLPALSPSLLVERRADFSPGCNPSPSTSCI